MTSKAEARSHQLKAREFLEAAELLIDLNLHNAAVSNSVISGINAKDVICLHTTGRTGRSDDHQAAVRELRSSGPAGAEVATSFNRLLSLKSKAQYRSRSATKIEASKAVVWARRLYEAAAVVATS